VGEVVKSSVLEIESIDLEYAGLKKGSLKGEVAVITGGASNVGLGFARAIAWAGAQVVISDINEETGNEAERVINEENAPNTALFVKCDITSEADVKNLAKKAFAKFGKVDILVNNAMNMDLSGLILKTPVSDLEKAFAISGKGVMLAIKEFVPGMIERKHGTVTYSATQFHYCPPLIGGPLYCAGKAAATSIVMSLANEVKDTGVNVFCITPAGVGRTAPPRTPPWLIGTEDTPKAPPARKPNPGFDGRISPEASGAAMVYCILNAEKLHGSGIGIYDAFNAMKYPYPRPETVTAANSRRLNDFELTLVLSNMGQGFAGNED